MTSKNFVPLEKYQKLSECFEWSGNIALKNVGVCINIACNNNVAFLSASRDIQRKQEQTLLHMVHVTSLWLRHPKHVHDWPMKTFPWIEMQHRYRYWPLVIIYYLPKCCSFAMYSVVHFDLTTGWCNILQPSNHTRKFHCIVFRLTYDWLPRVITEKFWSNCLNCKRHVIGAFRYHKSIPNHIVGHISLFTPPQAMEEKEQNSNGISPRFSSRPF